MKRKLIIPIIIPAFLIIAAITVYIIFSAKSLSFSKGRCFVAENGSYMLISDNSPIVMINKKENNKIFSKLSTGDEILVLHDGIMESYPAQTFVYGVFKTGDGDISDIPDTIIKSLTELGWIKGESVSASAQSGEEIKAEFSRVNYTDDNKLYIDSLNKDKMDEDSIQHLPILKFESTAELKKFKTDYANAFTFDRTNGEFPSFDEVTADFDDKFFESNTVFAIYIPANSGSFRYRVNSIYNDGVDFCIHLEQTNKSEAVTMDMVGWIATVCVDKKSVEGCSYFDADLGNLLY